MRDWTQLPTVTLAVGLLAGIVGVAGSYAVAGFTGGFVVAPVESIVVAVTPGFVVTFSILVLGQTGEVLVFLLATVLSALVLAACALLGIVVGRRLGQRVFSPLVAGMFVWAGTAGLTELPVLALGAAVPAALVVAAGELRPADSTQSETRRRLVGILASVAAFGALSYLLGTRPVTEPTPQPTPEPTPQPTPAPGDGTAVPGETPTPEPKPPDRTMLLREQASRQSLRVRGLPGLVTPTASFYEIDINSINPLVDRARWTLELTGAIASPRTLSYDDLVAMPAQTGFNTLRCVGESLNGRLMSTAIWTAVPLADLVDEAGPTGGCECVMLRAVDGYHEEFPLSALRRGFLAYEMDGEPLPRNHGAPVRALIPGHWGEINVKWLTEIEFLEKEADGFWEKRGWHGTGPVNTVAKLWVENRLDDGRMQVGGYAYAGTRGISLVEVSTDGGKTWDTAELSDPLDPADVFGELDVWRMWQYTWSPRPGIYEVVVRATDGEGTLQPETSRRAFPSGATGWVTQTVEV